MVLASLIATSSVALGERTCAHVSVVRDIEYARTERRPLLLDLYRPQAGAGRLPVIVSIHGGGWHGGSKEASPGLHFAEFGYAVVSVEYRLTGEAAFPAQIADCQAAARWGRGAADQ